MRKSYDNGSLVLAVDGGGAKTDVALVHSSGELLALLRGAGSHSHYLGIDGTARLLENLVQDAVAEAELAPRERPFAATAQILLAGADLPEELAALRERIERLGFGEHLVVDNDTLALLRAGTERGWGVAVVCGAGINCVGRAPDGREVRFDSLGAISGDWGGGTDVGLAALFAAARSADGRGPRTALEDAVAEHFGMDGPLEVGRALHQRRVHYARLGELARIVFALSAQDAAAAAIVERLAGEVLAFATAALRRLRLIDEACDVVLGGSLLRALSPSVLETISASLQEVAAGARLLVSSSEPIVGAALLGLDVLGAEPGAKARARAELDAAQAARPHQSTMNLASTSAHVYMEESDTRSSMPW